MGRFLGRLSQSPSSRSRAANVPGHPQYELVPDRDDEFNLKGISAKFVKDEDGGVTVFFKQPNGVFEAKRKEQ